MSTPTPPPGCEYGVWLQAPSVSGGKAWVGFRTFSTVNVHWGKISQINQSKRVDLKRSFPERVLAEMVNKKIAKGYQVVREWIPENGWSNSSSLRTGRQQQPLPPPPSPKPPIQTEPSKKGVNRLTIAQAVDAWMNSPSKGSTEKDSPDEWF
ncbi:MAG: hypothetical protein M0P16_00380 [Syntrophales bacterium]|jgi:hypothetical protein|nr:hypothetical protein [Syntrophales bacterium]